MYSTAYNLWTFTWFVHFELPFRLKGTEKIHTERFFLFLSIYSILYDCRNGMCDFQHNFLPLWIGHTPPFKWRITWNYVHSPFNKQQQASFLIQTRNYVYSPFNIQQQASFFFTDKKYLDIYGGRRLYQYKEDDVLFQFWFISSL